MKHLLRFLFVLVLLAAAAAVIARLRARLAVPAVLGAPETPPTAPPAEAAAPLAAKPDPADPNPAQDDLADIWGIGPVYRGRLAAVGIASFRTLAAASRVASEPASPGMTTSEIPPTTTSAIRPLVRAANRQADPDRRSGAALDTPPGAGCQVWPFQRYQAPVWGSWDHQLPCRSCTAPWPIGPGRRVCGLYLDP